MHQTTRRDHAQLLARARAALETPDDLDAEAIRHLIEDLSIAEDSVSRHPVPWPVDIHVAHIDHRQGTNIHATLSHEMLMVELGDYCRDWWSEIDDHRDPDTLADEEVVSIYFDRHETEWLSTERITWAPVAGGEEGRADDQ